MDSQKLQERSVVALLIGLSLVVVGGLVLNSALDSYDAGTARYVTGWAGLALGGMSIQAAIVGFVFAGPERDDD